MSATFKRNLSIGYGVSAVLLISSAILSFISINNLLSSADWVEHTRDVIKKLDNIVLVTSGAETGQRGYLLTGDEQFLNDYNGAYNRTLQYVQEVRQLTKDNTAQQANMSNLQNYVDERYAAFEKTINAKKNSDSLAKAQLYIGQQNMQRLKDLVKQMEDREQILLIERTEKQKKSAASTPIFIVIASLLAILVTVISYLRVIRDFETRLALQKELEVKDAEINKRISSIQKIAERISAGDYSIRVSDEEKDSLGSLAYSLNKMAGSLQTAFTDLREKEWLQTGIAGLNDALIGDQEFDQLTRGIITFVAEYTKSSVGAIYLMGEDKHLHLANTYALARNEKNSLLSLGQGLAGQAAQSQKPIEANNVSPTDYVISYSTGDVKPTSVIAFPVIYNGQVKGVIELASLAIYSATDKAFFETVSLNVGIAINTADARKRVYELLEETQAQSEELQAQHSELENINTELEAQSEKLQASEEELKVQQEELQQANSELEERSRLLEEKNEMIVERNIEIQAKAEALEVSTKYKSEFLANMSHELRTPLNSILLLSRLLSENHESNLSSDQVEYANVIQNSGNGLLRLIDEILDLSKIESGKMQLEFGDVSIDDLVKELKSLFTPIANEKNIAFEIEQAPDLPQLLETDKLRLEQILRNLLSNAIKFTADGSVTLSIRKENKTVAFVVKDTGIGIPKDKQQSIFEAFQQADGSTRRKYGGTGLGLSISRELAKLLGGEISLKSEEGKGSEFTLVLPIEKGSVLPVKESQQPAKPAAQPVVEAPLGAVDTQYTTDFIPASIPDDRDNITSDDKVLLIIEDDTGFARSLLDYTRKKGYKGVVAVRGDEGIELANRFSPIGILLDIQLPIKNGWEVMEELKRNPVTRPIPVHMMSSHQERMKSLTKGAVDFIDKPMAFEKLGEVFQKIEHALSRYPKKVLIVEENPKHAKALAYYLQSFDVVSEIKDNVNEGIEALNRKDVDCVILDMGVPGEQGYATLEEVKKTPGFENLPIIIFTGKNLSHVEEMRIKKYADSIVIKTAHSYQRILDEVSLFLHLVEENKPGKGTRYKKMGALTEVLKDKTVLIADDDVRNIFSLTKALENYGMHIVSAVDGKEALKQLDENPKIDIVLMDMMMPEMDGYESTQRIREQWRFKNLPVIAVTAKAMTGDREKCIRAGASDYITKPVDIDQLTSLLRVWLYEGR